MVTIYDIARISGVSKSTVSRVVSNHPHVSTETRNKVLKVMQEYNYVPNSLARQFRQKHTKCIAIIIPNIDHPYFCQLVRYISAACHKKGFKTVVHQTFLNKNTEKGVYTQLQTNEFDAIILASSLLPEVEIASCTKNKLIVACNEVFSGEYFDVFCVDEEETTMKATTFLLNKGLSTLAFCADNITSPLQQARLKGFILAHNKKGLNYTKKFIFNKVSNIEDGITLGDKIFKVHTEIDGIISGSDFVAAGLISSAVRNNIEIPKQLSIIGFDNHPISLITNPQISTISNKIQEISIDLVNHLINKIDGRERAPIKKVYSGEFINRSSS
ncbi:LacI family DNA-binding transcriptional regulator [Alkalihalophilus lindianensis]|uniref:LacI family DNA-binding transcriptional regulator n=1 Tax=Alkalihalophilus lindianensis TaxID=1630542 RepID=A0ABU3XG03_9BACI|nr:LacI family DNA-binding transcriptional regulator [Alkalihalophilus lindianensis]MDV2686827.1 LacI family DNA-binding transcriptional regulator [Alkalihalophilus lindianensis]